MAGSSSPGRAMGTQQKASWSADQEDHTVRTPVLASPGVPERPQTSHLDELSARSWNTQLRLALATPERPFPDVLPSSASGRGRHEGKGASAPLTARAAVVSSRWSGNGVAPISSRLTRVRQSESRLVAKSGSESAFREPLANQR